MNIKMLKERLIKHALFICAAFSIVLVLSIVFYMLYMGHSVITDFLLHGITTAFASTPINGQAGYPIEIAWAMETTAIVSSGATLLAVVIGLPCAIYMAEFADMRIRNVTKTSLEVLDGFPSIVIGVTGWEILSNPSGSYSFHHFLVTLGMSGPGCILFGWLILMVMSFPVIATISEDALRSVSQELREASLGLGATKWQTTREVLIPTAMPRILASILLALAAAMGETVALSWVLGGGFGLKLFSSAYSILNPLIASQTITIVMNNAYNSIAEGTGMMTPGIYAEAFILFAMIGAVNISVRLILRRSSNQTE